MNAIFMLLLLLLSSIEVYQIATIFQLIV